MMHTRIAPTPSGYMHAGNVFNFLLNWTWARSHNGKVLLRIDDGDAERKRKEYVEDIFRVLDWLELDWDIGPTGPDDFEKNWSQSLRRPMYDAALNKLNYKNLLFACSCSRKEVCHCIRKNIPLYTPHTAWKIKVTDNSTITFTDHINGDITESIATSFAVRKKDGIPAYQLSSVIDDAYYAITHICRGADLIPSTAMQLYIDSHCSTPHLKNCRFWHHPLLTDASGAKLSKSAGVQAESITRILNKNRLLSAFAEWMGWPVDVFRHPADGIKINDARFH